MNTKLSLKKVSLWFPAIALMLPLLPSCTNSISPNVVAATELKREDNEEVVPVIEVRSRKTTFYCNCEFDDSGIDLESCGYAPLNPDGIRTKRTEWEHVVPAEAFGHSFVEWREGHEDCIDTSGKPYKGRRCALKTSALFKQMSKDPINLVQVIGELNARRSNFSMAMIPGEKREFGECDIELENHKIEPRPEIRGDIARIYFYMDETYPGHGIVSRKNKKLFRSWAEADPLDENECNRSGKIWLRAKECVQIR